MDDSGLRLAELASIRVEHLDLGRRTIKVWGKGARQRIVRYGPQTESLLAEYLTL